MNESPHAADVESELRNHVSPVRRVDTDILEAAAGGRVGGAHLIELLLHVER